MTVPLGSSLPELRFAAGARRARLTGSHVYGYLSCEHRIALDLFEDPGLAVPPSPALERLLARGRVFEDEIVAQLQVAAPEYEPGDWEAAAASTQALLEAGEPLVAQGVLFEEPWLGIPDLLRRVPGDSRLGAHHYVVGDIKSSWSSRSDQALQVAFYSRLLARWQGRVPEHGFLILRSGAEERVDVQALDPVLDQVLEELAALADGRLRTRPHRTEACDSCRWRAVCANAAAIDWLPGLTRSTRELLSRAGFDTLAQLQAHAPPAGLPAGLSRASLLRARRLAEAALERRAVRTRRLTAPAGLREMHAVWVGVDGFDDRRLVFADRREGRAPSVRFALRPEDEVPAMAALLDEVLGREAAIVHGGEWPAVLGRFAGLAPELASRIQRAEKRSIPLLALWLGGHAWPAPVRGASEAAQWTRGEAPSPERQEQRASLAQLAALEELETLQALADAELAGLLELGVRLRQEGRPR